ncbi:retrovirus-related pol polyprotein from transposon TNT 1-94 [Tanacetum coccineum]
MEILLEPTSNKLSDSYKDGDGDASFQLKSDSLPHAHAQTTKTYYKHQDSRIKKAQVLKTKTSANSDKQDLPLRYQVYQGRLLASFQDDAKAIGTKWVFRNKKDKRGVVIRNKARLVVQGYTQEEGINYDKVFAPVARIEAIRLFLAYASFMGLIVYQMDVKCAFLYGTIEEEVYVCQPPGFECPQFSDKVYKVEKALYGLHQAPRACTNLVLAVLTPLVLLAVLSHMKIYSQQDRIFISQYKYVAEILKMFDLATVKTTSTPMEPNKALVKDKEADSVDVHLYRSMIKSLMYLTASRPDITFVVCACARFQVTPKTSHLHSVKRIFKYLKGQSKLGLWYPKDSPFDLEAFSDSHYASASLDRKSTIGEKQIHANVDGKDVVVSESSVRRDLHLNDKDGTVGYEAINEEIFNSVERAVTTASSLEAEQASAQTRSEGVSNLSSDPPFSRGHTLGSGEDSMEHQIELTDNIPNTPHDSPLPGVHTPGSDEGSLELNELMDLVTKLSHRVFDLEKVKTAQAKEITGLKRRVTKLEQRQRSRILKNHPFRFGSTRRQSLGKKDVSKQGRKHLKTRLQFGEDAFDDIDDLVDEGMTFIQEKDEENQGKIVNTAGEGVSTASISKKFSTAAPRAPPTTTVFDDEDVTMAMAQTFIKMKEEKAKEKETGLYERHQKRIQDFTLMDSEKEAQKPEEAAGYEKEKKELRLSLKIISNDDIKVDYEPLSRKFPIVNWEYQLLGKMEVKDIYVYKLTIANGSSSYHRDTQDLLRRLDRQDFNDLYRLVQERFQDHPLEGHDLLIWGDLRMIFDPDEKDELWMNQLDWKLLRWKLYESCGVNTLFMDGTPMDINILVEKKYPLIKE